MNGCPYAPESSLRNEPDDECRHKYFYFLMAIFCFELMKNFINLRENFKGEGNAVLQDF